MAASSEACVRAGKLSYRSAPYRSGGILAKWSAEVQFSLGKGAPIPVVATRRVVVESPYAYCRNPMALGTTAIYLGIAIWVGSLWAVGLASIYATFIAA